MINYIKLAIKWLLELVGCRISRIPRAQQATKFKVIDEFIDSYGNHFSRLAGYKDSIWPTDWDKMNEARAKFEIKAIKELVNEGKRCVANLEKFLKIYNLILVGKKVLDVGCFSGASTYALVEHGADHVEGIDVPENFADLFSEKINANSIKEQSQYLRNLRTAVADFFEDNIKKNVVFYELDVKNLIKKEYYDFIVSWSVLEHINDPEKAFKAMYLALRPNGICFHEYHPFFCTSGAHFDTLDFPWGHVRLSSKDFEHYIKIYRPEEYRIAKKRFYNSINRMTLQQLIQFSLSAGFEILEIQKRGEGWESVDNNIFSRCKELYPSITISDLITTNVLIVLRKPL